MPTTPAHEVGANVRAELARRDRSQADLARAIGVSQSGISKRLRGVIAFDVNELTDIARFLDVPLSDLLAGPEISRIHETATAV